MLLTQEPLTYQPVIRLDEFGAVGDGATDDTEAIQRAVNSLPADGGTILLTNGKSYLIGGEIRFNRRVDFTYDDASWHWRFR